MTYCRECGTEVSASDDYCGECGAEQVGETTRQGEAVPNGAGHATGTSQTTTQKRQPTSTKRGVHTELETDVLPRRVGALLIDSVLAYIAIMVFVVGLQMGMGGRLFGYLVLVPGYFALAEALAGHTPGKAVLGLTVVGENGTPVSTQQAVLRNVVRPIDALIMYGVGLVAILMTDSHQRLGDLAADTFVVRKKSVEGG